MEEWTEQVYIPDISILDRDIREMVMVFAPDGRILYGNQAAREELGYDRELIGLPITVVFTAEEDGEKLFLGHPGICEYGDMVAYRKNNTCFPVLLKVMPLDEPKGAILATVFNMLPQQTLEKEMAALKAEAEESLKIRNEFIANMTHELRTPVNGIKGHISALLLEGQNSGLRRTLEIILRCCDDMSAIINNILDFSKLEAGKFRLEESRFDLYGMLDHVVATNIAMINEKGLRIILNIADDVPRFVWGDELRLTQILNNLVSNAVKFTDIGYVSVDVAKDVRFGDGVELFFMVRDTGIGISPEDKDRLFQSFSQVDGSRTRKYGGTGLGLVITRELVELMGGSIRVDSEKGKGSNFSFVVRLKRAEAETELGAAALSGERNEIPFAFDGPETESYYQFGSPENINEIRRKAEILILALELEAWEKAEINAGKLKKLLKEGPEDMRKMLFRLEMAIRKEDEAKCRSCFEKLHERLLEIVGGI